MSSTAQIVARFVAQAGTESPRFLRPRSANVHVASDGRTLYSYGSHFTLCQLMPAVHGYRGPRGEAFHAPNGWWLVNGDSYSISTSRHQSEVRHAIDEDGRPAMIVSYDAMDAAGIDRATVTPIEVLRDRDVLVPRSAATLDGVPEDVRREYVRTDYPETCDRDECDGTGKDAPSGRPGLCWHRMERGTRVYRDTPERWTHDEATGLYRWTSARHVLGEAVFSANVETTTRDTEGRHVRMTYSASFLSAFDHQESHLHYFLAELPAGAHPYGQGVDRVRSVDDAFAALRPAAVRRADQRGEAVVRQGDMFAIPAPEITDAALKANGYTRARSGRLLGSSHVATETATNADGTRVYARGILHHRPEGWCNPRTDPGHRRQTMGDRRTWHLIVRNTVPRADVGRRGESTTSAPRSWTRGGNVD